MLPKNVVRHLFAISANQSSDMVSNPPQSMAELTESGSPIPTTPTCHNSYIKGWLCG